MNRWRVPLIFGLCCLLAAAWAQSADMPPGKWWKRPMVRKNLAITEEQDRRLDEAFLESRKQWIVLQVDVDRERLNLEAQLEKPETDEQVLRDTYLRLGTAQLKVQEARFEFVLVVRRVLTPVQFEQLLTVFEEHRRHYDDMPSPALPRPGRFGP